MCIGGSPAQSVPPPVQPVAAAAPVQPAQPTGSLIPADGASSGPSQQQQAAAASAQPTQSSNLLAGRAIAQQRERQAFDRDRFFRAGTLFS